MDHYERAERTEQARALLNNPIFNEVLDNMVRNSVMAIEANPADSMSAAFYLNVISNIRGAIQAVINDQKMAEHRFSSKVM